MDHMFPKNGSKIFFAGGLDMRSRKSLVGQITGPCTHKPSAVMSSTSALMPSKQRPSSFNSSWSCRRAWTRAFPHEIGE